jgi:hypothetical protein
VAPTLSDHWHDAFAFDICGKLEPNPPQNPNLSVAGLHTHGDGLIHVEPQSSIDTGVNATLGRFVSLYPGMELSATSVRYPGGTTYHNGQVCQGSPGQVQVAVWPSPSSPSPVVITRNPSSLRLGNGSLITVAFLPKGASIPQPPASAITALSQNLGSSKPVPPPGLPAS